MPASLELVAKHRRLALGLLKARAAAIEDGRTLDVDLPLLANLTGEYPLARSGAGSAADDAAPSISGGAGSALSSPRRPARHPDAKGIASTSELRCLLRQPHALKLCADLAQRGLLNPVQPCDVYAHYVEVTLFAPLPAGVAAVPPPSMPRHPIAVDASGSRAAPAASMGVFVAVPVAESKARVRCAGCCGVGRRVGVAPDTRARSCAHCLLACIEPIRYNAVRRT